VSSGYVLAQVPDAGALQQQLERQLPSLAPLPTPGPKELPPQPKKDDDGKKIPVKSFRFEGNTLFRDAQLSTAVHPWEDRELSLSELQEASNAISDFYRIEDYVARVVVPEQDATDGNILLQITEVKIDKEFILRKEDTNEDRFELGLAKKFINYYQNEGDFLRVDELQKGIMIVNELPGINFQGVIEPSEINDHVNFIGTILDTPVFSGRGELSNYGSRSTGIPQAVAGLNINDYWGNGSLITLSGIASEGSSYGRLGITQSFGYSGFGMGLSASYLDYHTVGIFDTFGARGNATTFGWNAYYPLTRGVQANTNLIIGFDYKDYLNLTSVPYATVSNYNLQNVYVGANGNFFDSFNALSYWSLVFTNGQVNINDPNQLSLDSTTGNTQGNFRKLTGAMNRYQNLDGDQTVLLISLTGQLANTNLNSAEQFYLGGPTGVRAYPVSQGSGSQGYIATLELQQKVPQINSQLIAFFDMGQVQQYKFTWDGWQGLTGADNNYRLYGAGFGIRYAKDRTQINAMLAWPIGNNPLLTNTGSQVNNDARQLSPQGWIQAVYYF
jgi:hemolysin activation/secretion protein